MKSPEDLGLPWADWRPGQRTAIRQVLKSKAKTVVVQAPTGSGKSAVALGLMKLDPRRSLLLTATKGLQDQYGQLAGTWLNDVRGMNNYACLAALDEFRDRYPSKAYAQRVTCDRGLCRIHLQCSLKERGCTYFDAYRNAVGRNWVSTSYAYYFASLLHGRGLGAAARVIGDEGHSLEEQLAMATQIRIPAGEVRGNAPRTIAKWRQWAEAELGQVRKVQDARGELEEKLHVKSREERLTALRRLDEAWAVERTEQGYVFEPIDVRPLAPTLHKNVGQVVLMSATITPATVESLGLGADVEYITLPMRFPIERRPVYLVDGGRIDYRATPETLAWWLTRMDQIFAARSDRKGLVHTVSYDRMAHIAGASEHRHRMIICQNARELPSALAKFRAMSQSSGAIFVAPNVATGFDFPYCVAPETRLLTNRLVWKRADQFLAGDWLAGFDEHNHHYGRKWRESQVLGTRHIDQPCVELELADGARLRCSKNHYWLVRGDGVMRWVRADRLRVGGFQASKLLRALPMWQPADDYASGYLAAAFDGEGWLRNLKSNHTLGFTQNPNVMLRRVQRLLRERGVSFAVYGKSNKKPTLSLVICGRSQILRLLGELRPQRLLERFSFDDLGRLNADPIAVVGRKDIGVQSTIALTTSTKTFIAEGFASHNCDAEYQIIAKVPFPNTRSTIAKARCAQVSEYRERVTMQNLVQAIGRIVRAADDAGETFVMDEHARWFMKPGGVASKYAPSHVLDAVVVTNRLPTPPSRLIDPRLGMER